MQTRFVPIKKLDFLIPDKDYDYYIYNDSINEFIAVKNEVVKSRPDLDYYIKDPSSDEMLKYNGTIS